MTSGGRGFSRDCARWSIPRADAWEMKDISGTVSISKMPDHEQALSFVGEPELPRVENRPRQAVPEVIQGLDDALEVAPVIDPQEARDVLDDDPRGEALRDNALELPPEPRTWPPEPAILAGAADVLAGEPAVDKVDAASSGNSGSVNIFHILHAFGARPVPLQD